MSILPFIDLLILAGWSALLGGFLLKLVHMTTTYRPTLFGIGPIDFLLVAGVFLLLSLTLSARTWVKAHEIERALARRKRTDEMDQRIAMLDGALRGSSERNGQGGQSEKTEQGGEEDADGRLPA